MAVIWSNPGAYAQLERVPEAVIGALPPPPRPLWPTPESDFTWRYIRAFTLAFSFVILAAYVHAKSRFRGSARWQLEVSAPTLAYLLQRAGILADLRSLAEGVDRAALFKRVYHRYAGEGGMSRTRAALLLACLRGDAATDLLRRCGMHAGTGSTPPVPPTTLRVPLPAAAAVAGAAAAALSEADFIAFMSAGVADVTPVSVYLGADEVLGVTPVDATVAAALEAAYDAIVASRSAGDAFTPAALSALCMDIGFFVDDAVIAAYVDDYAAAAPERVAQVQVAKAGVAPQFVQAVRLRKNDFVDIMAFAAGAAAIHGQRALDYLEVFNMMHLSGIREQAGVPTF